MRWSESKTARLFKLPTVTSLAAHLFQGEAKTGMSWRRDTKCISIGERYKRGGKTFGQLRQTVIFHQADAYFFDGGKILVE